MVKNGFPESKFAHIKPLRLLNFCKHITLAPAGTNCEQWIDINTKGAPQISSTKEPPQNQHLAESRLSYTAQGIASVSWVGNDEQMGDFTPSSPDVT